MVVLRSVSVVILIVVALVLWQPRALVYAYEDMMVTLSQSAMRAVEYGNRHFSAIDAHNYDIERASDMYRIAEGLDATYPGLQHQLARIEFLRGNFYSGLRRINREIEHYGSENPNAYYIRALILGYQGRYLDAAADYETYFKIAPANWAVLNDYAWVMLKADLPEGALTAVEWGLRSWPDNPWLLHNKVIALYELGRYAEAASTTAVAVAAVNTLTEEGWLVAYPGNDPLIASEGLAAFRAAVQKNKQAVDEALKKYGEHK